MKTFLIKGLYVFLGLITYVIITFIGIMIDTKIGSDNFFWAEMYPAIIVAIGVLLGSLVGLRPFYNKRKKTMTTINKTQIPPEVIKPKYGYTYNQREDLTDKEKERITKGQEHWKGAIPETSNGGYVTKETMEFLIDVIVDDVWTKSKDFYNKK